MPCVIFKVEETDIYIYIYICRIQKFNKVTMTCVIFKVEETDTVLRSSHPWTVGLGERA